MLRVSATQIHANDTTSPQQRLSFTRPDGQRGSTTLSPFHYVYTLARSDKNSVAALKGKTGASVDACEQLEFYRLFDRLFEALDA